MDTTLEQRARLADQPSQPSQWIDEEDIDAVIGALRGSWLTQGPTVAEFEARMAAYCGARYAVAVATGTAALHCAAFAAGVGPGDDVVTSPITFVASANCAAYLGATPVFADIDPQTLTVDPAALAGRISPRTKALIPVDFAGHPAEMDDIMALARRHRLIVIEDAAHSLGATYRSRRVGALADLTVFSFHPVKAMTTGEGGMILTDDPALYEKLLLFRTHGITSRPERLDDRSEGPWYYEMQALGFNYRITDLQCALGISQLRKLDRFVARRRDIARRYAEGLADLSELVDIPRERGDVLSAYHLYVVQLKPHRLRASRREVFSALRQRRIPVQVHYLPVHLQPYYRQRFGYRRGDYPQAEQYYERCLTLPLYPRMSDAEVARVIDEVRQAILAARA